VVRDLVERRNDVKGDSDGDCGSALTGVLEIGAVVMRVTLEENVDGVEVSGNEGAMVLCYYAVEMKRSYQDIDCYLSE